MKNKLLIFLTLALAMLFVFAGCEKEEAVNEAKTLGFENAVVEILCENGKTVVRGSFDNLSSVAPEYVVDCSILRNNNENDAVNMSKKFSLKNGENSFEFSLSILSKDQTVKVSVSDSNGESILEETQKEINSLRLLSIGNSFSVDAQQWLYGIAKDVGYENVVLGNLYIGGCSLAGHCTTFQNDRANYIYYKNTTGTWEETPEKTMLSGIKDEAWDYITLQQASGFSGDASSYEPYLSTLIKYVNENKKNPRAELLWNMTWAYSSDSTHQDFVKYDNSQMKMYEGIVDAVKENVVTNSDIAYVLPAGTAIQNARNSSLGDTLCRDGFHLDLAYGRYLAGLTWIHKITGLSIDDITYIPEEGFDADTLSVLKECAKNAVANPFEVTK